MKRIIILLLAFFIILPIVLGVGENEYLFEGETASKVFDVSINAVKENSNKYSIYEITKNNVIDLTGQSNKELIVIGPSGYIAEDKKIKDSLFTYYTFVYFTENKNQVNIDHQKVGNYIEINANTVGQKILNILKTAPELCKKIPKLEIIEICVKPSVDSEIMTIINKDIADWEVALAIFDGLRGKISRLTGPEKFALFENAEKIHQFQMTAEDFLKKIELIDQYSTLKSQPLDDFVGSNSDDKFVKLSDRVLTLKSTEQSKGEELDTLIKNITINIKEIAKLNGNFSSLNLERKLILGRIEKINFEDKYYTSDINLLDSHIVTATELKNVTSLTFDKTREIHLERNFFSRGFNRVIGFLRALSV